MTRVLVATIAIAFATAGCGDGGSGTTPPPPKPGSGTKPGQKKPDKKQVTLQVYPKIEDRVPVDERATIRKPFREKDFAVDPLGTENRDPFRSYVISQPGSVIDTSQPVAEVTEFCKNKKQLIAVNYNLRDLRLVGLVSRGPRKYALFQDTRDYGHVVHRGDCLGREKARVKEIAGGFVTLEIIPEQIPNQPVRPTEERSIPLYPEELKLEDLQNGNEGMEEPPTTSAPVTPPATGPSTGPVLPSDQPVTPPPPPPVTNP